MDRPIAVLEGLQTDLRALSAEARKKHIPIKEVLVFALSAILLNILS